MAASDSATAQLPGSASFAMLERALGQARRRNLRAHARRSDAPPHGAVPTARSTTSSLDEESQPFDADALVAQLNEKIFTDENHRWWRVHLPASLVCEQTTTDSLGNAVTALDPACVDSWDKIDLRIRVEKDDDLLRFTFQVGSDHDEPLALALTPHLARAQRRSR